MPESKPLLFLLTVMFVVACCIEDVRTGRIPNALSGSAIAGGILLNWYLLGLSGMMSSVAGLLLMIAALLGPFALGGIGGGDVKMMGAVGALTGPKLAPIALMSGLIVGGMVMTAHLVRIGRLREKLLASWRMLTSALLTRSLEPLRLSRRDAEAISLPYSVPLALGTVCVLAFHSLRETTSC